MTNHYYSKKPTTESKLQTWNFTLRGKNFRFETDAGVFSKKEVDFGSRVLIDSFIAPSLEGDILDIGCGYGPIGLAIASAYPDRTVQMVDVNERAISLARKNAEQNGIQNVRIFESDGLQSVTTDSFSAIVTNPPIRAGKQTIFRFYEEAFGKLQSEGELWIVIQKKQGAPSTFDFVEEMFGFAEVVMKEKGYWIIRAVKKNLH